MTTAPFITVVSGLPRSGTSMMMRMLERTGMPVVVDYVRKPDDDNPAGYYEFEDVKKIKESSSWVENSKGKAVKMVYRLLYDLPREHSYRVLFMRRNLDEVIASQRVMIARSGKATDEINDQQIASLFRTELAAFEKWVTDQPHIHMLDVNYNRIQQEPRTELARVNAFLGGELDVEAMTEVVDASLYRNRK